MKSAFKQMDRLGVDRRLLLIYVCHCRSEDDS